MTPIIPLKTPAPAQHPKRSEIKLSKRGVPLCPAGVEMIRRGTNRKGGQIFACPVKAGKLERCPQAPESTVNYNCSPLQKLGHTVVIKTKDNERLFPPIPRNHLMHSKLMKLRSGSERSFSVQKESMKLLSARHRRAAGKGLPSPADRRILDGCSSACVRRVGATATTLHRRQTGST